MPHLTLGQVFGALTYYSDRQEEINQYIEKNRIANELIFLGLGSAGLQFAAFFGDGQKPSGFCRRFGWGAASPAA
ncbi:MAG: hypothetical protein WBG38_02295 [Nodosilinea sp.]